MPKACILYVSLVVLVWMCMLSPTNSSAASSARNAQDIQPLEQPISPAADEEDKGQKFLQLRTEVRNLERWLTRDLVGTTPYRRWLIAGGPRFADVLREPLIGLNFRMRYGLTPVSSVGFLLTSFIKNPFAEDEGAQVGLGEVLLETKYRLPRWDFLHLESALNLQLLLPLTEDDERSDGVVHVIPSITFLRPLPVLQPLHVYTRFGIDIATDHIDRTPIRDEIQESFWITVLGLIYPTRSVMFFLDFEWQTNAAIGAGERHNVLLMPGIRYELPPIAWIPALVNLDLGVRAGLADSFGRFDVGFRLTFDPKKSKHSRAISPGYNLPRN